MTIARRGARGEPGALTGRSRCEHCGRTLGAIDLVPVVSWLLARGRCRSCGQPIAWAHPAAEVAGGLVGAVPFLLVQPIEAALAAVVGWWLLAAVLVDLHEQRLPDVATLPLVLAGLLAAVLAVVPVTPLQAALGATLGFIAFWTLGALWRRWRGVDALGLGDAKLLAAAGAWLGPAALPQVVLIAALLGIAQAAIVQRSLRGDLVVPFGPALALAFWAELLWRLADG